MILIASLALSLTHPVLATAEDDEEAQIIAVIDTFMRAINEADSDLKRSVMAEEGYKVARSDREGRPPIWVRPFAEDYDWLDEHAEAKPFRETYWDPTILHHGDMAMVWAPYAFDRDGQRTHCGVNAFNLMRVEGAWKITGVQYTAEPDGCPEGR
ncbi:Cif family virulence factor [Sphingomicrobium arenosum]|uniref:hypothetical protein n=1 Tax=Sphingomicrobium arenosum TaxID=2233861 RepID=UPI00223F63ED|nr:hypothetical protein [Sphingomicrobium arenosum]